MLGFIVLIFLGAEHARSSEPFYWGVSNAAFQVEGHPEDSDWSRWTHLPGKIKDGSDADQACDFWNRYNEDFALARLAGLNSFRISLAWERIEPREGLFDPEALKHYRTMIASMRLWGLEPVVTLHHYVLPAWLASQGGLLSPRFIEDFARYAEHVVSALPEVKWWITFNEPEVLVLAGYMNGIFPPGHSNNLGEAGHAIANIALAHIEAVRKIRENCGSSPKISIAKNWTVLEPRDSSSWIDQRLAEQANAIYNHQFIDALMTGVARFGLKDSPITYARATLPGGKPTLDFLGINYYTRDLIHPQGLLPFFAYDPGPGLKNDLGWEIYPEGFERALLDAYSTWHLPLFVTENGIADRADSRRKEFLREHLEALDRARNLGVPVLGYLHWSLTDNFEWAEGLTPRFGLVEIDYATGARRPRASYWEYARLISR